jgi:hypothetical protein
MKAAYTTARTYGGPYRILEFDLHLKRLCFSARTLMLQEYTGPSSSSPSLMNSLPKNDMIEIVNEIENLTNRNGMLKVLIPSLQNGFFKFEKENGTSAMVGKDRRLNISVAWSLENLSLSKEDENGELLLSSSKRMKGDDDGGKHKLKLHVNTVVSGLPEINMERDVMVAVLGEPRINPEAKDARWIEKRKEFTSDPRASGAEDVILSIRDKDKGDLHALLLEGSQTNIFVVLKDGTVMTAREGILYGTIREIIVDLCISHDIPLRLEPPNMIDAHSEWREVFLTSTSRLIMPVDVVRFVSENDSGSFQDLRFPRENRSTTTTLYDLLEKDLPKRCVDVFSIDKDYL